MYCARIPYSFRSGSIRIRRLLFTDIPFLSSALKEEGSYPFGNTAHKKLSSSWFALWLWIKKTFTIVYCIEVRSQRIGFIGLYNLELGKSSEIALVIFNKTNRRRGYGSKAFKVLTQYLRNHGILDALIVRVETNNVISRRFWHKLGFMEDKVLHEIVTMHIDSDGF